MKPTMHERDLFEYAVLRWVPRVEREEFMHVGVVLFCKKQKFLKAKFEINVQRMQSFCPNFDYLEFQKYVEAFARICDGTDLASPIAKFEPIERFRWLTANRSTILQVSAVHPGMCVDASETLDHLFESLVL